MTNRLMTADDHQPDDHTGPDVSDDLTELIT
jgi:hypothetical protein